MKKIISICALLALCFSPPAQAQTPRLAAADFTPDSKARLILRTQTAGREYVRVPPLLDTTTLPSEAQGAIASGLAWLGSHLGEGYVWSEISLARIPNGIPAVMSEPGEGDDPETFVPVEVTPAQDRIVAAIYGAHPDLGQSVIPQGELQLPDELRVGLLAVWDGVEEIVIAPPDEE